MVKRKRPNTVSITYISNYDGFVCVMCLLLRDTQAEKEVVILTQYISSVVG
jgi:hypothetical protein